MKHSLHSFHLIPSIQDQHIRIACVYVKPATNSLSFSFLFLQPEHLCLRSSTCYSSYLSIYLSGTLLRVLFVSRDEIMFTPRWCAPFITTVKWSGIGTKWDGLEMNRCSQHSKCLGTDQEAIYHCIVLKTEFYTPKGAIHHLKVL